ncbi:hypothetical protein PoB_003383200 [Plakobranchus ocellatus]|uniref:Uncharacterized protein n=1 Tax=Plakobranchus ocellatus TaxID=259542 RepID=A0AAV4AJ95_9GAST|nr:hypothetical protein PoB_003383200 [Plakobranchus ocellatus]
MLDPSVAGSSPATDALSSWRAQKPEITLFWTGYIQKSSETEARNRDQSSKERAKGLATGKRIGKPEQTSTLWQTMTGSLPALDYRFVLFCSCYAVLSVLGYLFPCLQTKIVYMLLCLQVS